MQEKKNGNFTYTLLSSVIDKQSHRQQDIRGMKVLRRKEMKKKISLISIVVFVFLSSGIFGEKMEKKYSDFNEVKSEVTRFCKQQKYEEAAAVYESVLKQFPEKVSTITWDLAVLYSMLGKTEKCMDIFEYGLERKVTYSLWPGAGLFKPLEKLDRFKKIMETNARLQAEATARTEAEVAVVTPEGYSDQKKYPLFIALHGWGGNAESFKKIWKSTKTGKEYIQAFVQSSQVVSQDAFGWSDFQLGRKDITKIYKKLIRQYPVDTKQIIIGGFSQGGQMALDIAIHNIIPTLGFVVLKPGGGIPDDFNLEAVEKAVKQGLRGTIITGEKDHSLADQEKMVKIFEQAKLPHRFIINKDQGHWFTKDLSQQMENAINHINNKQ
jgi:predicted esterase